MDLPPPTYLLLFGLTLLAYPFVLRAARTPDARGVGRRVLYAILLLETALVLLFYSKLVCWMLAGTAAVVLATAGPVRPSRVLVVAEATGALAAGLAFQFVPGALGFVIYFLWGLPILFGVPLARLVSWWLRYDGSVGTRLAALGVVLFAGWFPVSAFLLDFLLRFEVAHLAGVAVALGALAVLLGPAWGRVGAARRSASATAEQATYLGRPVRAKLAATVAAGVALGAVVLLLAFVPRDVGVVVWAAAFAVTAVGLVGVAWAVRAERAAVWRHIALGWAGLVFVGPLLALWSPVDAAYLVDDHVVGRGALVVGGVAATAGLYAWAAAWAVARELAGRAAVAESVPIAPAGAFHARSDILPDVGVLRRFARTVAGNGASSGVLTVTAPIDPLWTVPEDVHEWLVSQRNPDVRVHVAIEAREGVYVMPEVWPEEHVA